MGIVAVAFKKSLKNEARSHGEETANQMLRLGTKLSAARQKFGSKLESSHTQKTVFLLYRWDCEGLWRPPQNFQISQNDFITKMG